ncbi:hypothetical protein ACFOKI_10950 [Sphingomonas qilianensis]
MAEDRRYRRRPNIEVDVDISEWLIMLARILLWSILAASRASSE